jgi:hypothetical protein
VQLNQVDTVEVQIHLIIGKVTANQADISAIVHEHTITIVPEAKTVLKDGLLVWNVTIGICSAGFQIKPFKRQRE